MKMASKKMTDARRQKNFDRSVHKSTRGPKFSYNNADGAFLEGVYDKLLQYSFRLLAKKRYTSHEMQKKLQLYLKRRDIEDTDLSKKVSDRLLELKYIDDEQFAKDFVSDRVKFKPRGKYMMMYELKLKGVNKDLINEVLEGAEIDEEVVAYEALQKKQKQWRNLDSKKKRERSFRFLAGRGFKSDAIYKVMERCYYNSS